jgi:uncharacterized Zn finger protein (UPF0148 family)
LSSKIDDRHKVALTADLMRRGATLLNETCPRCGGVQIKFQGKVYCINEDDLSSIGSRSNSSSTEEASKRQHVVPSPNYPTSNSTAGTAKDLHFTQSSPSSERDALRTLLEEKLAKVSQQLESSQDLDQQEKLLNLISKYLETLAKLKNGKNSE